MRLFGKTARTGVLAEDRAEDRAEDPVVRQYRYLLRTASVDALERIHVEALDRLGQDGREAVLRTVQEQLVTGLRLQPGDVPALARLVVIGERRSPGALLRAYDPDVLRRLADLALVSMAAFGLLTGYAAWDGREPEPAPEETWQARKRRSWGDVSQASAANKANGWIPPGSGGFGGVGRA